MAYQLLAMAQKRWRAIRSPHLVQQLLDGTKFLDGRPVEDEEAVSYTHLTLPTPP